MPRFAVLNNQFFLTPSVCHPDVVARDHPAADCIQQGSLPPRRFPNRSGCEPAADSGIEHDVVFDRRAGEYRFIYPRIERHETAEHDGRLESTERFGGGEPHNSCSLGRRRIGRMQLPAGGGSLRAAKLP